MPGLSWGGVPLVWGGVPLAWGDFTPPDTGAPVVVDPFDEYPIPVWLWSAGPGASASSPGPVHDLEEVQGRTITFRRGGHCYAQFTVDGRSDDAFALLPAKATDLWCYRDSQLWFRGRVRDIIPQLDGTQHLWTVTVIDYRGMTSAAAAILDPVPTYTAVDQAAIAWDLIDRWQTQPGGDWGITEGVGSVSGTLRSELDLVAGAPVGEAIDRLAELDDGFEWEIDQDLRLNRWFPRRGSLSSMVLDYPGTVRAVSGSPIGFANGVVVTGGPNTVSVSAEAATVATDPRGRWVTARSFPSATTQDRLAEAAPFVLADTSRTVLPLTVELVPGAWSGPSDLWLGDTVRTEIVDGALSVSEVMRVDEIVIGCDPPETVRVALVGA